MSLLSAIASTLFAQGGSIQEQLRSLRKLPDDERVSATKRLAVEIRQLPAGANKAPLA